MGLFCKGLHCAGCGKGIPASLVILLVIFLLFTKAGDAIGRALGEALLFAGIGVGVAAIIVATIITRMYYSRRYPLVYVRAPTYTITERKVAEIDRPEWPHKPARKNELAQPSPFLRAIPERVERVMPMD